VAKADGSALPGEAGAERTPADPPSQRLAMRALPPIRPEIRLEIQATSRD